MEMLFEHYPPKINSLRRYKKDIQRISRLHCTTPHFTRGCIIPLHKGEIYETVISGTFKVGMGDTFDKDKMATFPAGSFAYLDPDMHHYAMASGEVIVQIHGVAPMQFNYIHPEDDPSKK